MTASSGLAEAAAGRLPPVSPAEVVQAEVVPGAVVLGAVVREAVVREAAVRAVVVESPAAENPVVAVVVGAARRAAGEATALKVEDLAGVACRVSERTGSRGTGTKR